MNDIHSQYQISNGDYLYTLMLFIAEPIKWINKYEWRVLDEREINVGELGNLSKVQIIKSRERRLYIVSGTTLELKWKSKISLIPWKVYSSSRRSEGVADDIQFASSSLTWISRVGIWQSTCIVPSQQLESWRTHPAACPDSCPVNPSSPIQASCLRVAALCTWGYRHWWFRAAASFSLAEEDGAVGACSPCICCAEHIASKIHLQGPHSSREERKGTIYA